MTAESNSLTTSLLTSTKFKVYAPSQTEPQYGFFIQRCGDNGGRPLSYPIANCFTVSCINEKERDQLFWLCYALWKTGAFKMYISGTVIPCIRLHYVRKLISNSLKTATLTSKKTEKLTQALNAVHELENVTRQKLALIQDLRITYLKEYLK